MANFVTTSVKNRLGSEAMLDCLNQYIALYEDTLEKGVEDIQASKWIFGTTPEEVKVFCSENELNIRKILCKKAFRFYLKSVATILLNLVCLCCFIYLESDFFWVSFVLFVLSSLEYTKSCKDWLFQDKEKNSLKEKGGKEDV